MKRRLVWSAIGQGLSSAGNMLVTVWVARQVDVAQFGAWSLAFSLYLLALAISRSVGSQIFVVEYAQAARSEGEPQTNIARRASSALGAVLAVALVGSLIAGLVGRFSDPPLAPVMYSLAIALPALLLQDGYRHILFAQGEMRGAALNDGLWSLASVLFIVLHSLMAREAIEASSAMLFWGASAALAATFGALAQTRLIPALSEVLRWYRHESHLIRPMLIDTILTTGSSQGMTLLVSAILGLTAAAAFRGAQTVFGPYTVLTLGATSFVLAEASALARDAVRQWWRVCWGAAIGLGCIGVTYTLLLLLAPDQILGAVLGDSAESARSVIPMVGVQLVALAVTSIAVVGLRSGRKPGAALRARVASVGISWIVLMAVLTVRPELDIVAMAIAVGSAITALLLWVQLHSLHAAIRASGSDLSGAS